MADVFFEHLTIPYLYDTGESKLFQIEYKGEIDNSKKDRRSGIERRKAQSKKYFLMGGEERRSWSERRNLWYLTM